MGRDHDNDIVPGKLGMHATFAIPCIPACSPSQAPLKAALEIPPYSPNSITTASRRKLKHTSSTLNHQSISARSCKCNCHEWPQFHWVRPRLRPWSASARRIASTGCGSSQWSACETWEGAGEIVYRGRWLAELTRQEPRK